MQLRDLTPLANRYYGMRHGESEANVAGVIVSDPARGTSGWGLTPKGRVQAETAASTQAGQRPDFIYCSDFLRARETAQIAAQVLGDVPVRTSRLLRERYFGLWEGSSADHYHDVWSMDATDPGHREKSVESVLDVLKRLLEHLSQLELAHSGKRILLISHGDPLQILQTAFADIDLRDHRSLAHLHVAEIRPLDPSTPRL